MSTKHDSEDAHILHLAEYFGFDPPDPKPTPAIRTRPLPGAFSHLRNKRRKQRQLSLFATQQEPS